MEPYNSDTMFIDEGYATGPVSWDNWEQEIDHPYDFIDSSFCRNLFGAVGNCLRIITESSGVTGWWYREDGEFMTFCTVCYHDLEKGVGGRYFRKSDGRIVTRLPDA